VLHYKIFPIFYLLLILKASTYTQDNTNIEYTSMPWVGFELTIPAFELAKAVHALDGAATVIGTGYDLLTYGAKPFLRTGKLWSPSRTSQHFMEPEGSITWTEEPSTGPYTEPYPSSTLHPNLTLIWETEVLICWQFEPTAYLKAAVGYGVLVEWREWNTEEPTYSQRSLSPCHFVRSKTRVGFPIGDRSLKRLVCQRKSISAIIQRHQSCYVNEHLNQIHAQWFAVHIVFVTVYTARSWYSDKNYAQFRASAFRVCSQVPQQIFSNFSHFIIMKSKHET
jgi:hypothetical protein